MELIDKSNGQSALNPNLLVKSEMSARTQHAIKKDSKIKNKKKTNKTMGDLVLVVMIIY